MKNSAQTTNGLRHNISINDAKTNCLIEIRLNDECKNGHEDFAITATFWQVGKPRTDRYCGMGGCCHDEILKVRPDLRPFVDLHLCDWLGAPMYAKANGWYLRNKPNVFREYCRLTDSEAAQMIQAEDENHFWYLLTKSDVPARWKREAMAATKLLEKMIGTGEVFESKVRRSQFVPMHPMDMNNFEIRVKSGYYLPEKIAARELERKNDALAAYIGKLEQHYTDTEWKERKERDTKIWVARLLGTINDNLIYYTHNDTLCLNWQNHSFSPMFTPEQIALVREKIGELPFPVTITEKN